MTAVHQFVPMLHEEDAVGRHTMAVREELRRRGVDSEIFVETVDPATAADSRPAEEYLATAGPADVVCYQFATASDLAPRFAAHPGRVVLDYHNVTPPELFASWDNGLARHQVAALAQLDLLAPTAVLGVADSEWNRSDLVARGCPATAVVPPVVKLATGVPRAVPPAAVTPAGLSPRPGRSGALWLSVGRIAPSKALEDAIAALFAYRARYDPEAKLLVVGRSALPSYDRALRGYAADLGLAGAVRFAGPVDDAVLSSAYKEADALVVTSDHEGFCLPLVEAMAHGLPVVAYRQGAVPEVLGGAGVLLDEKDADTVADALFGVRRAGERDRLAAAGYARLAELDLGRAAARLVDLLLAIRDGATLPPDGSDGSAVTSGRDGEADPGRGAA